MTASESEMDNELAKGVVGWGAILWTLYTGIRRVLKFWKAYRLRDNPHLSVRNGEYRELMTEVKQTREAVGRIERRQDRELRTQASANEAIAQRVNTIEDRLASS